MSNCISTDLGRLLQAASPEKQAIVEMILQMESPQRIPMDLGCLIIDAGVAQGKVIAERQSANDLRQEIHQLSQSMEGIKQLLKITLKVGFQENPEPVSDQEATRVIEMFKRLGDRKLNCKAPLYKVFSLVVLAGESQVVAAEKCQCSEALISSRVAAIEKEFKKTVEYLRALLAPAGVIPELEQDPRARKLYRRGLTDDTAQDADHAE